MKRKVLSSLLSLTLLASIAASPVTVKAEEITYKEAYSKVVASNKSVKKHVSKASYLKYKYGKKFKYDKYYYYDIDKNGIPELFVSSSTMKITEVFTFHDEEVISLGYYSVYGFNKKTKELVIQGFLPGVGGSSNKEWTSYKMNKSKDALVLSNHIDKHFKTSTVYDSKKKKYTYEKGDAKYKKIYKAHFKNVTKVGSIKKKKIK